MKGKKLTAHHHSTKLSVLQQILKNLSNRTGHLFFYICSISTVLRQKLFSKDIFNFINKIK